MEIRRDEMKRKYIIIILLIILILIIAGILLYIKNKNQEPQNTANVTNTTTTNSNNATIDEPENQETGGSGEAYSRDQLSNYELVIYGLTEENTQKIPDVEEFKVALKEYIFQHGLTNADSARLISTAEQGNIVQYVFQLMEDNIRERETVIAHVNVITGKCNFGYQK